MTTQDLVNIALAMGGVAILVDLLKAAARWFIGSNTKAKAVAISSADYIEALMKACAVIAEKTGQPGASKAAYVLTEIDKFLESCGIEGDAKKVTMARAKSDLDALVADLFPVHKPAR